jgi:tetratricopeptide (TPR) repeat protein
MKKTSFYAFIITILFMSCNSKTNSPEFIKNNTGRYLYNSDEIIEVYFNNTELFLKWHGAAEIQPLKVDENTFYVKEMNEKIQFKKNPENNISYIVLVPKNEKDQFQYNFRKLNDDEKTPTEYLLNNEFDKALEAYQSIKQHDSLDPIIEEAYLNRLGYNELKNKNFSKALAVFKINMALYPNSSNTYDSYADALFKKGDTIEAIEYYKKSLTLDSGNSNAKRQIKRLEKKE